MDRKIIAVGFAGACSTVIMWQLGYWLPDMMMSAPVGLEAAFTGIIGTAVGYLVPNKAAAVESEPKQMDAERL